MLQSLTAYGVALFFFCSQSSLKKNVKDISLLRYLFATLHYAYTYMFVHMEPAKPENYSLDRSSSVLVGSRPARLGDELVAKSWVLTEEALSL